MVFVRRSPSPFPLSHGRGGRGVGLLSFIAIIGIGATAVASSVTAIATRVDGARAATILATAILGAAVLATAAIFVLVLVFVARAALVLLLILPREVAVEAGAEGGFLSHGGGLVGGLLALVGEEGDAQSGDVLLRAEVLGVRYALRCQDGVERADAVELHLVAVGQHLLDAELQLGDDADDHVLGIDAAVLHDMLGHVGQSQCAAVDDLAVGLLHLLALFVLLADDHLAYDLLNLNCSHSCLDFSCLDE